MANIYVPKSWSEITLEKYQELIGLDTTEYNSPFSYKLEILAILNETSVDDEMFEDLDINELTTILDDIKWLMGAPNGLKNEVKNFKLKPISKITLGEFIDLVKLFENVNSNLDVICSILFKKYKVDEWDNEIEEPYIYDLEKRRLLFSDVIVTDIIGIIRYFLDFKDNIFNIYSIIFTNPDDLEEPEDVENLTEEEIEEIKKEIEIEKGKAKWAWMSLVYDLCNGDLTKTDDITNLSLVYVLNTLMMVKQLDIKK